MDQSEHNLTGATKAPKRIDTNEPAATGILTSVGIHHDAAKQSLMNHSAPASKPIRQHPETAGQLAFLDLIGQPANIAMMLITVTAFCLYFYFWLYQQARMGYEFSADWGHVFFVPLVGGYVLWQHRGAFALATRRAFWPGLLPVLAGIVSYLFFVVGVPNHFGQGLSLVLTLFGVVLTTLGPRAMRYCFFPIAYCVFAITVPEKVMTNITFQLQLLASKGSYVLLEILGVPVNLSGNVLTVINVDGKAEQLNIAEQCAGMRTLVSFIALGGAVCLVATRAWWKRVVLMALTVPVALVLNILRVAVLAFLAQYNAGLSAGEAHTLIGTLLLIPGFFIYLGVVWALNKAVTESSDREPWDLIETSIARRAGA